MLDINECEVNSDECQQICGNIPGSYVCGCYIGFTITLDGRSCRGEVFSAITTVASNVYINLLVI